MNQSAALDEGELRRVIDSSLDGMIVIDASGTVLLYSAACERLFGYTADEVLGNNVKLLMTSSDRDQTTIRTFRTISGPAPHGLSESDAT